jgi:hypothetical protein
LEDGTEARSTVTRALAEAAAKKVAETPEVVEAAIQAWLPGQIRKQLNKGKVVDAAAEQLAEEQPQPAAEEQQAAGAGPAPDLDEDWLNTFERFAEDASTERLQKLWGRVLAGEIKSKGTYSKRTLRFIAELDNQAASSCQEVARHLIGDFIPRRAEYNEGPVFQALFEVQQLGLLDGATGIGGLSKHFTLSGAGTSLIHGRTLCLLLEGAPGTKMEFSAAVLTGTGREVFGLLEAGDERARLRQLVPLLQKPGIRKVSMGRVLALNGQVLWAPMEELFVAADPAA